MSANDLYFLQGSTGRHFFIFLVGGRESTNDVKWGEIKWAEEEEEPDLINRPAGLLMENGHLGQWELNLS